MHRFPPKLKSLVPVVVGTAQLFSSPPARRDSNSTRTSIAVMGEWADIAGNGYLEKAGRLAGGSRWDWYLSPKW